MNGLSSSPTMPIYPAAICAGTPNAVPLHAIKNLRRGSVASNEPQKCTLLAHPAFSNPVTHFEALLGTPLLKSVPRYSIGMERPPDEGMLVPKVNGVDSYFQV
jgi:hypothetical protein